MIQSVRFQYFKILRKTALPLGRLTLLVGPNGSGKSTALQGLLALANPGRTYGQLLTVGAPTDAAVEVAATWTGQMSGTTTLRWTATTVVRHHEDGRNPDADAFLSRVRLYQFDAAAIAQPVPLAPNIELATNGGSLAAVLDQLRDRAPERFEQLNEEVRAWLPEFDRVLFETPGGGIRAFQLRLSRSGHVIRAHDLSHGTLIALAILTLAYLPDPPSLVCLEEPDRGIHPRLLHRVRDALYRLSNPEDFGESRVPVQVLATTHSPYFLDLYRDHPEEVVIAHKTRDGAEFERLSDRADIAEILGDAHLGDAWYSGVLGGVPIEG